jgi:branched-chain amino acid transport system permease protein
VNTFVTLTAGGIANGAVYAALGLSLVIIYRATQLINFAQPALALVSAYLAYAVNQATEGYWLGFAVALLSGAVLGALSDRLLVQPSRRYGELSSLIVTLGLLLILQSIVGMVWTSEPLSFGYAFDFVGLFSDASIFAVLVVLATAAGCLLLFKATPLGLRMRAAAFKPEAASLSGVRVGLMVTVGAALAATVGALAGLLAAPPLLSPTALDGIFVYALTAAVIGGLDNPIGTVAGGFAVGIGLSFVSGLLGPELVTMASLAILVIVLSVRPHGLFGRAVARKV